MVEGNESYAVESIRGRQQVFGEVGTAESSSRFTIGQNSLEVEAFISRSQSFQSSGFSSLEEGFPTIALISSIMLSESMLFIRINPGSQLPSNNTRWTRPRRETWNVRDMAINHQKQSPASQMHRLWMENFFQPGQTQSSFLVGPAILWDFYFPWRVNSFYFEETAFVNQTSLRVLSDSDPLDSFKDFHP